MFIDLQSIHKAVHKLLRLQRNRPMMLKTKLPSIPRAVIN